MAFLTFQLFNEHIDTRKSGGTDLEDFSSNNAFLATANSPPH